MTDPLLPRAGMRQTLEAALAARGAVFPAKGEDAPPVEAPPVRPTARLAEALAFAIEGHGPQVRKGTAIPYVTHLLAVCALVGESGGSEEEMVAALLHDVVEDGGGLPVLEEIRRRFGGAVAEIVMGCTDTLQGEPQGDGQPGRPSSSRDDAGGEKAPWLERKRAYLAHLASAPLPVLRVSCADKLHNARAIERDLQNQGPAVWRRFKADREGTLWYYRSLARMFAALVHDEPDLDPGFRAMIRDLRETVAGIES